MNASVLGPAAISLHFLVQVCGVLRLDELDNGDPTRKGRSVRFSLLSSFFPFLFVSPKLVPPVSIVDIVSESWRVDDGQLELEALLLQLRLSDLDLSCGLSLLTLHMSLGQILVAQKRGGEKSVHKGSLPKTRFT